MESPKERRLPQFELGLVPRFGNFTESSQLRLEFDVALWTKQHPDDPGGMTQVLSVIGGIQLQQFCLEPTLERRAAAGAVQSATQGFGPGVPMQRAMPRLAEENGMYARDHLFGQHGSGTDGTGEFRDAGRIVEG